MQIDISGWDTHSAQGPLTGGMANNMRTSPTSLAAFHQDVEGAGRLNQVTVAAISEFGRKARENGSQGTDHGHGNCMFVMGGNINGGRVMANWPGLRPGQLNQNQDLASRSITATSWPRSSRGASATATSTTCSPATRRRSAAQFADQMEMGNGRW